MTRDDALATLQWFAVRTKSNREAAVVEGLSGRDLEAWCPRFAAKRGGRPIFPGYVFCRLNIRDRLPVLMLPGVYSIVSSGKTPLPIDQREVASLRVLLESDLRVSTCDFLQAGDRVNVKYGPLAGADGFVVRSGRDLVVSITLLQRSVFVAVQSEWLEKQAAWPRVLEGRTSLNNLPRAFMRPLVPLLLCSAVVLSQKAFSQSTPPQSTYSQSTAHVAIAGASAAYVLGPGDQFSLEIADLDELNGKVHRIDNDGTVTLPLVGRIQAAGLTLAEFQDDLDKRLTSQLIEPHITVTVTETLSQPVTVVGSVNTPGIQQMRGKVTLVEILSRAGGLRPDAGYRVTITRQFDAGPLPLPGAARDEANRVTTGETNVSDILEARNAGANITILPHDVITVPRAKVVYVVGEVHKSGGFTLEQASSMSVVQAIALAEGTTPTAARGKALIIRQSAATATRTELPVDIGGVMSGKKADVFLQAGDILFVPNSLSKVIRARAIETAVSTAAGVLIWRGL